jgi:hypothetical protein
MSTNSENASEFDPLGMMKGMRDANMDAWAKMMTSMVNTDAYAGASAEMLNTWLSTSTPFRKTLETVMTQTLTALNLATGDDFVRMGERLTNIEMRLDDMEAKLDECLQQTRADNHN